MEKLWESGLSRLKPQENRQSQTVRQTGALLMQKKRRELPGPCSRNSRFLLSRQLVIIFLDYKKRPFTDGLDENLHLEVQCFGID